MLVNGKRLSCPSVRYVVFPRLDGDIVFKITAVLNFDDFEKLCPYPEPPWMLKPGGIRSQDVEDADYKKAINEWSANKIYWMILRSISSTESLEWETVKLSDTETWPNFRNELVSSGLTELEVAKIQKTVFEVNGLDEDKIKEATDRFLQTMQKAQSATPITQSTGQ